jgi:chromosome segregation ATPase
MSVIKIAIAAVLITAASLIPAHADAPLTQDQINAAVAAQNAAANVKIKQASQIIVNDLAKIKDAQQKIQAASDKIKLASTEFKIAQNVTANVDAKIANLKNQVNAINTQIAALTVTLNKINQKIK